MMVTIIITLFIGIAIGLLLAISTLWIIKINCPKCKQLKPIREVTVFHPKERKLTGKHCQKCQSKPEQVDIEL